VRARDPLNNAARADEDMLRKRAEPERTAMLAHGVAALAHNMRSLLSEVDLAVLTDEFATDLAGSFIDGLTNGVDGWVDDNLGACRPWGFDLADITVPTFLWQGELDLMVPFGHGEWLAEHIPGVTAHLEPGQGHMSIVAGHIDDMIGELIATLAD
jgi:pimeloyl-ACP methyl ester carboxylesterase